MASITAAFKSNAPACAPCHIMANSPDTLYTAKGWVGNWGEHFSRYALFCRHWPLNNRKYFSCSPCLWLPLWCPGMADPASPSACPHLLSRPAPAAQTQQLRKPFQQRKHLQNRRARGSTHHGSEGESSRSGGQLVAASVPERRLRLCGIPACEHSGRGDSALSRFKAPFHKQLAYLKGP